MRQIGQRLLESFNNTFHYLGAGLILLGLRILWGAIAAARVGRWGWGEIPWLGWGLSVTTIATGVLLLVRPAWGRRPAIVQFLLLAAAMVWVSVRAGGVSPLILLMIGFALWFAYDLWSAPEPGDDAEEEEETENEYLSRGIHLLCAEPAFVDSAAVARFAERAFGVPFVDAGGEPDRDFDETTDNVVSGGPPDFELSYGGVPLLVRVFDSPVPGAQKMADEMGPSRVAEALASHLSRICIAARLHPRDSTHSVEVYRLCGRLAAEFFEVNCLAVALLEFSVVYAAEPAMAWKLRSDDPVAAFQSRERGPLFRVRADDPDMMAAIAEARARWPEFVAEFRRRAEQTAATGEAQPPGFVKVPFDSEAGPEFMWLEVTAIEGDFLYGVLNNDPGMTQRVASGDRIRKPLADVSDWILEGPEPQGGFTLEALRKIREREENGPPDA